MSPWLAALPDGGAGLLALAAAAGLLAGAALGALVAGLAGRARAQRAEAQAAERAARIAALEASVAEERRAAEVRAAAERRDAEARLAAERAAADALRSQVVALERERAGLEAELQNAERAAAEKLAVLEHAEKTLREAFTALSADALRANSQSFLELARTALGELHQAASADLTLRQQAIDALVKPVADTLARVDTQLRAVETARQGHYAEIKQHIELVARSHETLHGETRNLVRALRAPAVRGRWGEIQLRRVVELAGMVEHCDFTEQPSVDTEEGRLRPDLVIHLPGEKRVVVDAKAPLEAYLDAAATPDDAAREAALARHAAQVRAHMSRLGEKRYWAQFQPAPEFAVLFLPGETFFAAALEQDPGLIEWGVERKVIVASPTTLIALLRAVAYGWQQERAARNAEEISRLGRELHGRIGTLLEHFGRVGRRLGDAVEAYNATLGTLETRVAVSARKLDALGAGTGEELAAPEPVEERPRESN
jgi:DNA recombination protein RmuC